MIHRTPAEAFPVRVFIAEEMLVRGWLPRDVVNKMGGSKKQRAINELTLLLILFGNDPYRDDTRMGDAFAHDLAAAFGVNEEYFLNLENAYFAWKAAP